MTTTQPAGQSRKRTSLRTDILEDRPVNLDGFVEEWPEKGIVAMESAFDPEPGVRVEDGVIVELDGKPRADFDFMDTFIAAHAIDIATTEVSMAVPSDEIARMIIDPRTSRDEVLAVIRG
jgi:propanediol dehydratase large subunit